MFHANQTILKIFVGRDTRAKRRIPDPKAVCGKHRTASAITDWTRKPVGAGLERWIV